MCKVKNGLAPPYIADLFVVTSSQYNLRNSDFTILGFRTVAYCKHSLTYLGPDTWFKVDKSIRSPESLDTFQKRIKLVYVTNINKYAGQYFQRLFSYVTTSIDFIAGLIVCII